MGVPIKSLASPNANDYYSLAEVENAYAALLAKIAAAEARVATPEDALLHGRVAARLLDTAAEEYGVGDVDGDARRIAAAKAEVERALR